MSTKKTQTMIEHIVLFKVKDNIDSSKINSMVKEMNSLITIKEIQYLSAGPILRNISYSPSPSPSSSSSSSPLKFTHVLYCRFKTLEDLDAYAIHPKHLSIANESILPNCDDFLAVDLISNLEDTHFPTPKSGSAIRVTLLRLKEKEKKKEVLRKMEEIIKKRSSDSNRRISIGENFSSRITKGFSIGMVEVFMEGRKEIEGVKMVDLNEGKVKDLVKTVLVLDFVVPTLIPSRL